MMSKSVIWSLPVLLVLSACSNPTGPSNDGFRFTASPIAKNELANQHVDEMGYLPSGQMQPYAEFTDLGGPCIDCWSVFAPADGVVTAITEVLHHIRIEFQSVEGTQFYLGNIASANVSVGESVTAGRVIGRRVDARGPSSVTLGVINPQIPSRFVSPTRYPDEIRYADDPLKYFTESLKAYWTSRIRGPLSEGTLSYDVPGTLQGLWYHPSVPPVDSSSTVYRYGWLWFFYSSDPDSGAPSAVLRVALPYPDDGIGPFSVKDPKILPRDVRVSTGLVSYRLLIQRFNFTVILLVQMIDDRTVRAESFNTNYVPNPTGFTDNAQIYIR